MDMAYDIIVNMILATLQRDDLYVFFGFIGPDLHGSETNQDAGVHARVIYLLKARGIPRRIFFGTRKCNHALNINKRGNVAHRENTVFINDS
jgi:hypothetical protein